MYKRVHSRSYLTSTEIPEISTMRALFLLFFVGFAAASFYDDLDEAAELVYQDFMLGMEEAGSLKEALGLEDDDVFADESEDEIKTELGNKLRETLNKLLERIKEGIEKGKEVRGEYMEKLKELKEKLKELKVDMGDKAKELLKKVGDRVRNFFKDLLDKIGDKKERSVDEDEIEEVLRAFDIRSMFNKLKKMLLDKVDKEKVKAKVEELFGKGNEIADRMLEIIKEKGEEWRKKLHELIDQYLGKKDKRSLKEMWEKVKNYFKDLHIDLKEKYFKFGEWVKEAINKGLEKSKDKLDNIKKIAQELRDHAKEAGKDVFNEGLEFLRPYKEDLGALWKQLKDVSKDVFKNQS